MPAAPESPPLLLARDLAVHRPLRQGVLRRQVGTARIVDGVDLRLIRGETLALVGEPGTGKSALARALLFLDRPTGGDVIFAGVNLADLSRPALRDLRRQMQLVFANPYTSLNPRLTVGRLVAEPLAVHGVPAAEWAERVRAALARVGLNSFLANRRPYELSGGLRQRAAIARALTTEPQLLILDEPTLSLDPVAAGSILDLLAALRAEMGLTLLHLTADIDLARRLCERVAVFYAGRVVELATTAAVTKTPLHPYTQALLSQAGPANAAGEDGWVRLPLTGAPPDPSAVPAGCAFHPRCPHATAPCRQEIPPLRDLGVAGAPHGVACHHAELFA